MGGKVDWYRFSPSINSLYPAIYLTRLGQAQFGAGRYEEAAETLEESVQRNPENDWPFVYLVATYGLLDLEGGAIRALERANELWAKSGWGELTTEVAARNSTSGGGIRYYFKWFGDYKPLRKGLRKAGVKSVSEWRELVSIEGEIVKIRGATIIDVETAKAFYDRRVPFVDINFGWHRERIPGANILIHGNTYSTK